MIWKRSVRTVWHGSHIVQYVKQSVLYPLRLKAYLDVRWSSSAVAVGRMSNSLLCT